MQGAREDAAIATATGRRLQLSYWISAMSAYLKFRVGRTSSEWVAPQRSVRGQMRLPRPPQILRKIDGASAERPAGFRQVVAVVFHPLTLIVAGCGP